MFTEIKTETEHYYTDDLNRLQGELIVWWENGILGMHCSYKDDNLHGEYRSWCRNGTMHEHSFYIDDELHGEYKEWYTDGNAHTHRFYKHGIFHGEYKEWCNDGTLHRHNFYVDGKDVLVEVIDLVHDIEHITEEERILIKLIHNIDTLRRIPCSQKKPTHKPN